MFSYPFWRRFFGVAVPLLCIVSTMLLLFSAKTHAADTLDTFELDANASDDGLAGEDWATVNLPLNDPNGGSTIAHTGVLVDSAPQTVFTTGGSKDVNDISKWRHSSGAVPDKDDITNAYAAAYNVDGDLVIYFGADRYANEGDAQLGFWMFQDTVKYETDGTFSGTHQVGDLLVLINIGGDGTPHVQVLEWVGSGGDQKQGTLNLLFDAEAAECGSPGLPDDHIVCALTNLAPTPALWPYIPKDGTPGVFPELSFFEGGINLTQLYGGVVPCFATFMAETRSSESVTAQLKDFVLGTFPVCGISVQKACQVVRLTTDEDDTDKYFLAEFSGQVLNTGAGMFPPGEVVTVIDDAGTPVDTSDDVEIVIPLTEPFYPNETLSFSGSFYTNQNPPVNTVRASITIDETTSEADPFTITCNSLTLDPDLNVTKICTTTLTNVGDLLVIKVLFEGQVCNEGDVPLTVTVEDDMVGGVVLGPLLIQPGDCESYGGEYLPTSANEGVLDPGSAQFTDTVTAVGTSPVLSEDVIAVISATCPLCPSN